jgi:hypothetical protein
MLSSLWRLLREVAVGKRQRFMFLELGRRRAFSLAELSRNAFELQLSAFNGPHP